MESYTLCLAQLALSYIFLDNFERFCEHADQFFEKNKTLNHLEMELEMLIVTGFVYNIYRRSDLAKEIYNDALNKASSWEAQNYRSVSLCNIGIIEAEKDFEDYLNNLN